MSNLEKTLRETFATLRQDWQSYALSCPFKELRRAAWRIAKHDSKERQKSALDWLALSFQLEAV